MGACEPGQGRKSAAISGNLQVRLASHPAPSRSGLLLLGPVNAPMVSARGATGYASVFPTQTQKCTGRARATQGAWQAAAWILRIATAMQDARGPDEEKSARRPYV